MISKRKKGWVIVDIGGERIIDFTFERKRTDAIQIWVNLWSKPSTWKSHYKKGYRCVRAVQVTEID